MLKATKLTFAAMLLVGSCGLAMAQASGSSPGGASGANSGSAEGSGVSTDRPVNNDRLNTTGSTAPSSGGAAMQQKNTNMPTQAGPNETGTAKDTAGTATQRDPAKQKQ
jgi:hypothetical protein